MDNYRKPPPNDYLKYWRVIRYFVKSKYGVTLLRDGWITVFRKRSGNKKALYEISYKGRRMIGSIYKKLNGEEIPVSPSVNPMFLKNVSYTDKVYRNMIKEM